jgi:trimethylamine:corrinoid methyltransferase-like protein
MDAPAAHSCAADLWPPEAIEAIRATSLELLARIGVQVDSSRAQELLVAAGCTPGPQGRVLIPAAVAAAALAACPKEYTVVARDPAFDVVMNAAPGDIRVHNMGEAPDVADPRSGEARRATFRDQVLATRVMHHCRYPDSINSLVTPGDVPGRLHPLYSYLAIAAETDKLIGGPGLDFPWQARYLAGMAEAVAEARPGERPGDACVIEMGFSPVSPLHLARASARASSRRWGWAWPCRCSPTLSPAPRLWHRSPALWRSRTPRSSPVSSWCSPWLPARRVATVRGSRSRTRAAVGCCAAPANGRSRR